MPSTSQEWKNFCSTIEPAPHTGSEPILDPLRDLPEPTVAGMTVYNAPLGQATRITSGDYLEYIASR